MTEQSTDDTPPTTREERLAALAEELCRTYSYGIGLEELERTDPEQAQEHRDAAHSLLKWIEERPREERRTAYTRGYDRGREVQKRRTAEDVARLEAEVAELRQGRDPEGLRARIRDLEYALRGVNTHLMGRDRHRHGAVPDWKALAGEYLATAIQAQREAAELRGHQPSDATRRP
ncbi:hypothetical protein ACPB9J_33135 [Streptomyces lavendulocolor]|uniref:hypothetical protein n=1 Tax=Streptomyces lavendulocolor TaxID=67316 RepID=UPI003C2C2D21